MLSRASQERKEPPKASASPSFVSTRELYWIKENHDAMFFEALPQRGNLCQEIEHFLLFCYKSSYPQIRKESPSPVTLLAQDLRVPGGWSLSCLAQPETGSTLRISASISYHRVQPGPPWKTNCEGKDQLVHPVSSPLSPAPRIMLHRERAP